MDIESAQRALTIGCSTLGLQSTATVSEIKHGSVWVVAFDQDPAKPNFAYAMIKLERWLKAYTGNNMIELQCESLEDKNKRDVKSGRRAPAMVNARGIEALD